MNLAQNLMEQQNDFNRILLIEKMTIEELRKLREQIEDPAYNEIDHLKPRMEAVLKNKVDAHNEARGILSSDQLKLRFKITAALAITGLIVAIISLIRNLLK